MIVEKLKEKYQPLLDKIDYKKVDNGNLNPDVYLFQKWHRYIENGFYGFALGKDVPFIWASIIDDFMEELKKLAPNFTFSNCKLKFGGLRFYVETNLNNEELNNKIHKEIDELEEWLFNDYLIY